MDLKEYLIINNPKGDKLIYIKLRGINKIKNMSFMFFRCTNLLAIPDISNWDTSKVIKMNSVFNKCTSLISLPDISK